MELCIAPPISTLPKLSTINTTAISARHLRHSSSPNSHSWLLSSSPPPPLPWSLRFINLSVAASDETPGGASSYVAVEEKDKADAYSSESRPVEGEVVVLGEEGVQEESSSSASASDSPFEDFLASVNVKLEDDAYSVFLYGGGALLTVWLAFVVVGAIDSIPVFPKLMEVVGVGYSIWFTYRYLLFKKDRDELAGIIERFKQEILGSKDG